ncbi:DUF445 family protein [Gracilibacillus oryzae]|uniref:DUF445 family protein n=1 Tax=Gracilibacillus oryzae TaxID=1672701 RepID=A0A7C8KSG4_9BACI|nr:DUF445 family protein [Gracilibacillus oryzae]KAB8139040.1 DUF445 family protein [Gracilibacillus oryzae]
MSVFITLLLMVIIGGLIGGVTNSLAIKMLFRPYEAKYIGKWKIPFTPGVIPKRRDQLAIQLGELVVNHLVTADSLQNKLQEKEVKDQVIQLFNKEFHHFLRKQLTVDMLLNKLEISIDKDKMEKKIGDFVLKKFEEFIDQHSNKSLEDWLTTGAEEEINSQLEQLTHHVYKQIIVLINQPSTKQKIEQMINEYAQSKGFFGNMLLSMISGEDLSAKVQDLLTDYFRSEDGYSMLQSVLDNEWKKLKQKPLSDFQPFLEKAFVKDAIRDVVIRNIPVENWLNQPVQTFILPLQTKIEHNILPKVVDLLLAKLTENVPAILANLKVEKMVEKQVASFPTARIEDIILSISRKEFKLITYLGALLGGVIGLIQGILFVLVG